ncbi:hypothetical protein AVEN_149770-1 [Araneus ventricosus]|uniref:Uncharacterized protein n=1 Tax=Araneus ventricosus TaxID=182803 RepID=A0A4Y2J129_ARAVE|nr:hypothetical protein AVEN_149770-1 [Araneus ventricosus]
MEQTNNLLSPSSKQVSQPAAESSFKLEPHQSPPPLPSLPRASGTSPFFSSCPKLEILMESYSPSHFQVDIIKLHPPSNRWRWKPCTVDSKTK